MPLRIQALDSVPGQTLAYSATSLPSGLSINSSSGIISGTPSAPGTFSPVVTATDTLGVSGSVSFTWFIIGGGGNTVTVTNPGSQTGQTGFAASLQIAATDSATGQTLTFSATNLPSGTSISASGLITGTYTTTGTFSVIVKAIDTTGAFGTAAFTWTITTSPSAVQARVGFSIPTQAFKTPGFYAFGRTQDAADATLAGTILNRPRSPAPAHPLAVKRFWNGGTITPGPSGGSGPGDFHFTGNFNNLSNYVGYNTRVVLCIRPLFYKIAGKDPGGTPANFTSSSQLTSAQKALAQTEVQHVQAWLATLASMGFSSTKCRVVLWQEPANGQNNMSATDYGNMFRTYGPSVNSSVASDGLPYPLIANVNFVGGGVVNNATDYANAALGLRSFAPTNVTVFGIALDYYTNSYFKLSGSPPWAIKRLIDDTDSNGDSISGIADANHLPFGLHEFGTPPKQVDPGGAPWTFGTQYFNYITNFMTTRIAAGKPNLDCMYYQGQGFPDGSTDITSPIGEDPTTGTLITSVPVNVYNDFRVPLFQAFFDAVNGN